MRHLFHPSESDLFTQYLLQIRTSNDTRKLFLEDWCIYFTECVNELVKDSELAKLLLEPKTFYEAFLKLTGLITGDIESAYSTANTENEVQALWEPGLVNLIETWCKLFSIDTDMYYNVRETLDASIERWLKARRESPRGIYGLGHYMNEWSASTNCSSRTSKWIKELNSKLFAEKPSNEVEDK
ncbi:unnamed protein product [Allacma fusca]|uniref:Uncharacterized protein n=1 Tax=Allacma fusca TaxID=39272 RepID=A0A8J2K3X2_9HEXA|nr:unnamed protein product [Allacma fusca]